MGSRNRFPLPLAPAPSATRLLLRQSSATLLVVLLLVLVSEKSIAIPSTHPLHKQTHTMHGNPSKQVAQHPTHAFAFLTARPSTSPRARPLSMMAAAHTLYDFPVSNNGGRCRVVIYDKGVQDQFE